MKFIDFFIFSEKSFRASLFTLITLMPPLLISVSEDRSSRHKPSFSPGPMADKSPESSPINESLLELGSLCGSRHAGYHLADAKAPSRNPFRRLWVMWQGKERQGERQGTTNRKHPRSKYLGIVLLTIQLLIIALIFVAVIYVLLNRKNTAGDTLVTITPPTTRYHRFPPGVTTSNAVEDDDTVYKALIYTDHAECTNIGRSFLVQGGNAQDAALSALICLSAAHPHNTGLGGGFFAMIGITGKCVSIDARETASKTVNIDHYVNQTDQMGVGITSVATPGFLPGIHTLFLTASGKFSLQELARPTIDLCNSGIFVDDSLANALKLHRDMIVNDYIARKQFVNTATNDVLVKGDRMYCSKYSQTLSEIVEHLEMSDEYMDQRPFSDQLIAEMEEAGGYVHRHDMEDFYVRKHVGEMVKIGDFNLCGPVAPSAFVITALTVQAEQNSNLQMETIFPMAYRELKKIGDYEYDASNDTVPEMFKESFVKHFIKQMEDGERAVQVSYDVPDHSTILVADEFGRAVSLSASIGDTFGSRFYSRLGFFYNNAISSFNPPSAQNFTNSHDPEMINFLQPGKAPRTFISPLLGFYGDEVAFLLSGADLERQAETVICLLEEEDCRPDETLSPAIRQVDEGYQPLLPNPEKMAGY